MPEQFDPAWEYWEPNSQIVEAMGCGRLGSFDDLGVEGEYGESFWTYRKGGSNFGFRIGRYNPDRLLIDPEPLPFLIGFDKPKVKEQRRSCGWCTRNFTVTRTRKSYCGVCCPNTGGYPVISNRVCVNCGCSFKPKRRRHSGFCSRKCSNQYTKTKPIFDKGCPICGSEIKRSGKGRSFAKVYCSAKCQHRAILRRASKRKGGRK